MKLKIAALAASSIALTGQALAQTPAPAAAPAVQPGPPITGLCVFSQEQAIGTSVVGKFVVQRLQQLDAQTNAELNAQKTEIENSAKTLEGQRATLAQEAFTQQATALNQRAGAFQQTVNVRMQESELTQQKALQRVGQEMGPLMLEVFTAQKCAILVDRNAVLAVNNAMDITPQVVQKLDAKIQQFAFDRERLPAQGAAAPAAAPAAAAPAAPARRR